MGRSDGDLPPVVPLQEQRSGEDHVRALRDPHFRADGIWCGDEFVGILYHWQGDGWHYVRTPRRIARPARPEHGFEGPRGLLRRPARHSGDRSSGGRNLDPAAALYRRLGFVENPHEYIHPSFRRPFEQHRLVLMSYPSPLTDDEARRFADFVRETVLRYTEHEAPQLPPASVGGTGPPRQRQPHAVRTCSRRNDTESGRNLRRFRPLPDRDRS